MLSAVVYSGGYYLDNDKPWTALYTLDPAANITDPAQLVLVLGGEARHDCAHHFHNPIQPPSSRYLRVLQPIV